MNKRPNALQRLITRVYMLPILTPFWARFQRRIDEVFLRVSRNKYSMSEILGGISIVQLSTIGAKTGRSYTIPLVAAFDEKNIILIASNFGGSHNPGWYYNLKKNPECHVQVNGRLGTYTAHEVEGEDREQYWQAAAANYKGYEMYKKRAPHRKIPVILLKPVP